jgi:hypothetical protein
MNHPSSDDLMERGELGATGDQQLPVPAQDTPSEAGFIQWVSNSWSLAKFLRILGALDPDHQQDIEPEENLREPEKYRTRTCMFPNMVFR